MTKFDTVIKFFDSNKTPINQITIPGGVRDASTSLLFFGMGYSLFPYGGEYNTNQLHLLENFAHNIAPPNPIEGQLWFDTADNVMKVSRVSVPYRAPVEGNLQLGIPSQPAIQEELEWVNATGPVRSIEEPTQLNQLWFDETKNVLKYHNGIEWLSVAQHYLPDVGGTVSGDVTVNNNVGVLSFAEFQSLTILNNLIIQGELITDGIFSTIPKFNVDMNSLYMDYVVSGTSALQRNLSLQTNSKVVLNINNAGSNSSNVIVRNGSTTLDLLSISSTSIDVSTPINFQNRTVTGLGVPTLGTHATRVTEHDVISIPNSNLVNIAGDIMTGQLTALGSVTLNSIADNIDSTVAGCAGLEWQVANTPSTDYYVRMKTLPGKLFFQRSTTGLYKNTNLNEVSQDSPLQLTIDDIILLNPSNQGPAFVKNLAEPVNDNDGVTKGYVDALVADVDVDLDGLVDFEGPKSFIQLKSLGNDLASVQIGAIFNASLVSVSSSRFRVRFNSAGIYPNPPVLPSNTDRVRDNFEACISINQVCTKGIGDIVTPYGTGYSAEGTYEKIEVNLERIYHTNAGSSYFEIEFQVRAQVNNQSDPNTWSGVNITNDLEHFENVPLPNYINIALYW